MTRKIFSLIGNHQIQVTGHIPTDITYIMISTIVLQEMYTIKVVITIMIFGFLARVIIGMGETLPIRQQTSEIFRFSLMKVMG